MAAFLEDITPFLGDGTVNEQRLDLKQFLDLYDPNRYDNPSVTADIMVFWSKEQLVDINKGLKVLMIRRKNHPGIGWWALPGGFVDIKEDADKAAARELEEETGLCNIPMEQLYAWGDYKRDPRTRIVTISYITLLEEYMQVKAGDDAQDADWFDVRLHEVNRDVTHHERDAITYELELFHEVRNVCLTATVIYSYNKKGLLKNEKFEVIDRENIAFDHPAFIVKGLRHLESCLKSNK